MGDADGSGGQKDCVFGPADVNANPGDEVVERVVAEVMGDVMQDLEPSAPPDSGCEGCDEDACDCGEDQYAGDIIDEASCDGNDNHDDDHDADDGDEWKRMVAYDIETTGLNRQRDSITVVCVYGYRCGKHGRVFNFLRSGTFEQNRDELLRILDEAPRLASFNGVRFDAPFIQNYFGLEDARVGAWIQKTFDVWEICKSMLRLTFSMQKLLEANGFQTGKTGTGLQAIEWAKHESTWPLLEKYCLEDARLTYEVSVMPEISLPLGYQEHGTPDEVARFMSTYKIVKKPNGQFQINIL